MKKARGRHIKIDIHPCDLDELKKGKEMIIYMGRTKNNEKYFIYGRLEFRKL